MSTSRRLTTYAAMAVGLVAFAFVGASCSSGSSSSSSSNTTATSAPRTTTSTTLPTGYTAFTDHTNQFRIAVPHAWRQIDPSSPGASQSLSAAVASNPALKRLLGSNAGNLAAQGIKFLAADPTSGASVNVVVRPAPGGRDSDVEGMVDVLKQQYASAGIGVTNASTISLAGHKALHVALNGVAGPHGRKNEIQEFLAANDLVYVITYAGDSNQFASIRSTFDVSS